MHATGWVTAGLLAAAVGMAGSAAPAQSDPWTPAEQPPLSYTAAQYVDSRGCVFIRAGYGGRVTWVPRFGNDRRPLCGQRPSLAQGAPAAAAPAPAPVPAAAAPVPAPAPAARPRPDRVGAPMDTIASTTRPPRISAPAAPRAGGPAAAQYTPAPVASAVPAPPAPAPAPAPALRARVVTADASCPRVTAATPRYVLPGGGYAVACGAGADGVLRVIPAPPPGVGAADEPLRTAAVPAPAAGPAAFAPRAATPAAGPAAAGPAAAGPAAAGPGAPAAATACPNFPPESQPYVRAVPGFPVRCGPQADVAVAAGVAAAPPGVSGQGALVPPMPAGYRAAWEDDRLNPRRAQGTAVGEAAMSLIWTQTVPRRLIDRRTGRDVTALFPQLVYPHLSTAEATAAAAAGGRAAPEAGLSTRGAPPPAAAAAPAPTPAAAGRIIQVGAFAVPANAAAAVTRLRAAGVPAQAATVRQRGRAIQLVTAGPFAAPSELAAALATVHRAGFADAFARN